MATSVTMQLNLVNPVSSLTNRTRFSNGVSAPRLQRNLDYMKVQCISKSNEGKKDEGLPSDSPIPSPIATPRPKKVRAKTAFFDIFKFSGPGPERINGRLAMVGFVGALVAELSTGKDVFTQIANGGVPWFLGTSVLLIFASLVPLLKGVSAEAKSDGIFTSDAEIWNGRFAMLGIVALAFTEYMKRSALL